MPSSSARCAQLPRAADKVPFYAALKKFRDYLNGLISELDESEVVFHDSKPSSKGINGGSKLSVEAASAMLEDEKRYSDATGCGKKKRGRPRKGLEKQLPYPNNKKERLEGDESGIQTNFLNNNDKYGRSDLEMDNTNDTLRPDERKRRGRPKKPKMALGKNPSSSTNSSTSFPLDTLENNTVNNIGACQTQTTSSVSSGYSTGTASSEERRRDENGSLSNAGSGGPSPSHHSFTTQSDLSSEISAAISCGSPAPSPLHNGQHDTSFDANTREDATGKYSKGGTGQGFRNTGNYPPHGSRGLLDLHGPNYNPYGHPSFDNRHSTSLNNRSQSYQQATTTRGSLFFNFT